MSTYDIADLITNLIVLAWLSFLSWQIVRSAKDSMSFLNAMEQMSRNLGGILEVAERNVETAQKILGIAEKTVGITKDPTKKEE